MNKPILLTISLLVLTTGCSSFNRQWKAALAQPDPSTGISGAWDGRWLSDNNGHTGKLRGLFTKTGSDEYNVRFHATFWKIFHATYQVPLKYEERNGEFFLKGEQDLGKVSGGIYSYEAKATPQTFFSTYKSRYDHGTFEMKRPQRAQ